MRHATPEERAEYERMLDAASEPLVTKAELDRVRAENDSLRESYYNLRNAMWDRANARAIDFMTEDELRGFCASLYDLIDELRDLANCMYHYYAVGDVTPCELCDLMLDCENHPAMSCKYGEDDFPVDAYFKKQMCELGIEVDE